MMHDFLYLYSFHVTKVYDGDTITGNIDLGFGNVMHDQKLRLYGINAPEVKGKQRPEGLIARDWLRDRILDKKIVIRSYKDRTGKYGRWLAEVFAEDENGFLCNLNREMVNLGLAKENYYK